MCSFSTDNACSLKNFADNLHAFTAYTEHIYLNVPPLHNTSSTVFTTAFALGMGTGFLKYYLLCRHSTSNNDDNLGIRLMLDVVSYLDIVPSHKQRLLILSWFIIRQLNEERMCSGKRGYMTWSLISCCDISHLCLLLLTVYYSWSLSHLC